MPCLSQYSGREADSMFNQWDPQASFAWFDSVFLFGDSSLILRNCNLGYIKWGKAYTCSTHYYTSGRVTYFVSKYIYPRYVVSYLRFECWCALCNSILFALSKSYA